MNKIEIDGIVEREPRSFGTKSGETGLSFTLLNQDSGRKLYVPVTMWNPGPEVQVRQNDHVVVFGQLVNRKMSNVGVTGKDVWEKAITAHEIRNLNVEHAGAPEFEDQEVKKDPILNPIVNHPDSDLFDDSSLPF